MRMTGLCFVLSLALFGSGCFGEKTPTESQEAVAETPEPAPAEATKSTDADEEEPPVTEIAQGEGTKINVVSLEIQGSLERSLRQKLEGSEAGALSQVTARMLVWWVNMAKDLRKGDSIVIAYELPKNREPTLHAVRFESTKLGKTFRAYRFQPKGHEFAHFFDENGQEIEETLKDSPIDTYDQITSILKDGRKHRGVDFRAPTGTDVKMPFDATLSRKNWKFKGNGNCLDFVDAKGRHIIFLHLDDLPEGLKVGQRFKKGQVVAKSGNTGRSFGPHLHYQLEDSRGRVLDPFEVHETYRKTVPTSSRAAFESVKRLYDEMLNKDR